jgi:hypothetical protein
MTNFLTQLAARTLELAPIVQPRIVSVFASEVGQGNEAIASTQLTTDRAESSVLAVIAPPPLLVNPDRSALPIAHLPPRTRAIVPQPATTRSQGLLEQTRIASLEQTRPASDLPATVAGDRGLTEHNQAEPLAKPRAEPSMTSEREFPLPNPLPSSGALLPPMGTPLFAEVLAEVERVAPIVPPDTSPDTSPDASPDTMLQESAIVPNPRQAARSPESLSPEFLSPESLSPLPVSIAQPSSGDRQAAEIPALLDEQSGVRREAVLRQAASLTTPPAISQPAVRTETVRTETARTEAARTETVPTDLYPLAPAAPPLVVPRQVDAVSPIVVPKMGRSQSRQTEAMSATVPLPTIQVTIGRIEVRAVPSPQPPRPRVATPPARLSLEDYLRSRSGGN